MRTQATNKERDFRNNMQFRMSIAPVTFPYIDYEYIKQFPLTTRALATMNLLTEEELEKYGLRADYLPDIMLAKWKAAKYIIQVIKSKGMIYEDVTEVTGINKTLLAKMSSGARPLSSEIKSVVPLCYDVIHQSCHRVMFGEDGKIVLPAMYSQIAKMFAMLNEDDRRKILQESNMLRAKFERLSPTVAGVGLHREPFTVARERTRCLAHEWCKNHRNFLGDARARRAVADMRTYLLDNDLYEPSLTFAMFLSMETGLAVDYFIVEDFTKYVTCFYRDGDETVEIRDMDLLRFVGNVIAVDQETSIKMTAPLYAADIMRWNCGTSEKRKN